MAFHFKMHYTVDEARALLPQIRNWLEQLDDIRARVQAAEQTIEAIHAKGADAGGKVVEGWAKQLADFRAVMAEFESREIQIKDLNRGLLDFPAIIAGREVFLCWERCEEDVEHWHDLDAGYAGREPL